MEVAGRHRARETGAGKLQLCDVGIPQRLSGLLGDARGESGPRGKKMLPTRREPNAFNNAVSPEVFRGFGFPGAEDLGNMFQFERDFNDAFAAHVT